MKVSALEIKIADKCFAIEMSKVKHFFEVEEVFKVPSLPECVEGIVHYNNYVYPLISLKSEWGLKETYPSTAVVVIMDNKEYAVLIDEVLKIDKLEKKETFLLDVFEENGELISHLNLDFLKDKNIPTFNNTSVQKKVSKSKDKESFLLFRCEDEILAIDTKYIKKVEDKKGDSFILNNAVLNLIPFEKIYKKCEYNSVLVLENEQTLAIGIDEIIDIYFVEKENMTLSYGKFDKYFIYNQKEVKAFSEAFLDKVINQYGVHTPKAKVKNFSQKEEILILNICNKEFAVRMKNVKDIVEYSKATLKFSDENPYVKGLATTKEGLTYIVSFEKVLGCEITQSEDNKLVVLKSEEVLKALLIEDIKDIVYVNKENIIEADGDSIVGGMVLLDDKMIPLVNLKWPKDL